MTIEKNIERDGQEAHKIFNNRSLKIDYRTLLPLLKKGLKVLDVGCGTGAISKGIADIVGDKGKVVGIDNTNKFILNGIENYGTRTNLEFIHADVFKFETNEKFDLVVSARTLQWLVNPKEALVRMKSFLKPNGTLSILDYNHTELEWNPKPPKSMQLFYAAFLKWRDDAGMNNQMSEDLENLFKEIGLKSIKKINSDEYYDKTNFDFINKVGIWSKVAGATQMVEEGYLENDLRLKAIQEYDSWVQNKATSMTMKLKEVRGQL